MNDDGKPHIDQVIVMHDVVEIYGHVGEKKFSVCLPATAIVCMNNVWVDK